MSNHLLRDLGFESRQVVEIMTFIAGASEGGRVRRGADVELSYCVRAAANTNEADNVELLHRKISDALRDTALEYEILFVDDGSRDRTLTDAEVASATDRVVKMLSRRFGGTLR